MKHKVVLSRVKIFFQSGMVLCTFLIFFHTNLLGQSPVTYTVSGTWTAPACVNSIDVQVWGAGGAGGGEPNTLIAPPVAGGGGGGGAYSYVTSIPVVAGTVYTIIVGTGGGGGVSDGQDGQESSATFGATNVTANGGKGGKTGSNGDGGDGGTAGVGGTAGGKGFDGEDSGIIIAAGYGGGGGGGGGTTPGGNASANGTPGGGGTGNISGTGGRGADPNLANALFQTSGAPGEAYGGGGGGANSALIAVSGLGGDAIGGDGADGAVIITYAIGVVPIMISATSETACSGVAVNLALVADVAATFTWSASDNANITGESTSEQTTTTITDILVNSNTANEVVTYTVTPTATTGGCEGLPQVVSITVSPEPILSSTLTPTSICSAETFTYTPTSDAPSPSFAWTRAAVPGITEAGGMGAGSAPINKQLTNETISPINVVYVYTTTDGNGCVGPPENVTVTVNPNSSIVLFSAIGTDNQDVCEGNPIIDIEYTLEGSATGATATGLPVGVSGTLSSPTIFTISGTSSVIGTFDYTVTTSGNCGADSLTGSLTIGNILTSAGGTDSQVVCNGDPIIDIDYIIVGGDSPPPVVTGLPTGVTGSITSPGVFTISGSPTEDGSFDYSLTTQGGGCSDKDTLVGNLSVGVFLSSATETDTQSVCKDDPIIDIIYGFAGDTVPGPPTIIGLPPGVTGIATDTNIFIISGAPTVNGSYTYTITTNGSCGTQSSINGRIIVGLGLVITGTDTQSVCKNEPIVDINYNFGGTTPTVSNLPAGVSSAETAPGVLTISGTPTEEGRFEYVVTTNGCSTADTLYGNITVGLGLVTSGTDTQAVCNGDPITDINYEVVGGDVPPPTVTGLPTGLTGSISSPGIFTISGTPTVDGLYSYTVSSDTTAGCGAENNLYGSIAVGMQLTSAVGTDSQTVCKNSPIIDITYAFAGDTIPGPPTISGSLPTGVVAAVTSPGVFTVSGTPTSEGIYSYTITTNGACPTQSSLGGVIDVGAGLSLVTANDTQKVCKTEPIFDIDYVFVGAGTPTLSGEPAGITGSVTAPNIFTITGTPLNEGAYIYTVSSQGDCPSVSTLSGRITVGIGVTVPDANNQSICEGDTIADIDYTVVGGDVPPPTLTGLPPGVTGIFTSPGIFTLSGTPSLEGTFNYTITTDTTGTCPIQSVATGTLTIGIGVTVVGTDTQTVCNGDPIIDIVYEFIGTNAPAVTGLPPGVAGATTGANEITISGTPTVDGVYSYTVTSDTLGGCPIESVLGGQITVGVGLVSAGLDTQMVCKNEPIVDVVFSYSGDSIPVVLGLPAGVMDSITGPNEITISGIPTVDGKYAYTISTSGCTGSSTGGHIIVGLGVVVDGADTQSVCNGDPIVDIEYFIVGGDVPAPTVIGLPAGVTSTITSPGIFTISGTPTSEGIYSYTVTTNGAGCPSQSSISGVIAVGMQLLSVIGTDTQSVCKTDPIVNIVYAYAGGDVPPPVLIGELPLGVTGFISGAGEYTISGMPTAAGAYTYTLASQGTCTSPSSLTGRIIVGLGVLVPGADTQAICKTDPIVDIDYLIIGGDVPPPITTGLPTGVVGSITSPGIFTISGTPSQEGLFIYTVTTQGGGCVEQSTVAGRITVGLGLLTPGSDDQTVCTNDPIVDIEYIVAGGDAPPPTTTGLPPGVTGGIASPGIFVITGAPTTSGVYPYTISSNTAAGCAVQSVLTGTITAENSTIALNTSLGSDNQNVCTGDLIQSLSYVIGGTGTGAVLTGTPAGLTGSYSGGIFTITGVLDSVPVGAYTYTVTPTGSCVQGSMTFTINNLRPIARFVADYYSGAIPFNVRVFNTSKYANTYEWYFEEGAENDTATNARHTYKDRGVYDIRLIASQDSLCPDTAYFEVTAYHFEVPTVFSPNGDNINDFLYINEIGIDSVSIEIFNRWGVKVAGWGGVGAAWDGYNSGTGKECPDGTYMYIIRAKDMDAGLYIQRGTILLIR